MMTESRTCLCIKLFVRNQVYVSLADPEVVSAICLDPEDDSGLVLNAAVNYL